MSIRDAAAELHAVLAQIAEPAQAIGQQSLAIEQLTHAIAQADAAKEVLTAYLADVAAGSTTSTTQSPTPRQPPPQRAPDRPETTHPLDRVEQLRAELPPPLEGPGTGRKTHGRWFIGDQPARPIVSGEDDDADLAAHYLAMLSPRVPAIRTHTEAKLAAMIRQHWETTGETSDATLMINHEVCPGRMSCHTYLPRLLPPGCSITVVTPKTRHTFTGEPT